jgi:hypothetical protein
VQLARKASTLGNDDTGSDAVERVLVVKSRTDLTGEVADEITLIEPATLRVEKEKPHPPVRPEYDVGRQRRRRAVTIERRTHERAIIADPRIDRRRVQATD